MLMFAACGNEAPPPPDANPDDLDGDGVLNAADNCPERRNADQHDEDGDAFGDECDNCPAIANANQADTTEMAIPGQFADGVGDSCDLRPGLAGDKIAAFYGFGDPADANGWSGNGFTITNDALTGTTAHWDSKTGEQGDGAMFVARIDSLMFVPGGAISIAIDGDGISTGGTCTLRDDTDADGFDELVIEEKGAGVSTTVSMQTSIAPDRVVSMVAWRSITGVNRDAEIQCRVIYEGATRQGMVALTDDTAPGTQSIGVMSATVRVASLLVLTSPGPKSP